MPRFADRYGRITFFKWAMVLSTGLYGVLMVSSSFTLNLVSILLLGFLASIRNGIGWPYLLETVPKSD